MQVDPAVVLEGFIFSKVKVKVKVTRVKGLNNGPISMKLGGWMQGRVTGSKIKVTGSKVKVKVTERSLFVCLCVCVCSSIPPMFFGPIFIKLGGWMQGRVTGSRSRLRGKGQNYTSSCPLCTSYSSLRIISILGTNVHHNERVCHAQRSLT